MNDFGNLQTRLLRKQFHAFECVKKQMSRRVQVHPIDSVMSPAIRGRKRNSDNGSTFLCQTAGDGAKHVRRLIHVFEGMVEHNDVVFPWHFRKNLMQREAAFLASGGRMIFPLPKIEIVGADVLREKERVPLAR